MHQQLGTRSLTTGCAKILSHSKSHHPKAHVSKKATAAQSARNEAMAARSLMRKLDLRKAIVTLIGNAIKKLHRTQHEEKPCSFHIKCQSVYAGITSSLVLNESTGWQKRHWRDMSQFWV
jgi:uncharacterized protein YceK